VSQLCHVVIFRS